MEKRNKAYINSSVGTGFEPTTTHMLVPSSTTVLCASPLYQVVLNMENSSNRLPPQ